MTSQEFCYWLQGVFEVGGVKSLNEVQTALIRRHLALVFERVTDAPTAEEAAKKMRELLDRQTTAPNGRLCRPLVFC